MNAQATAHTGADRTDRLPSLWTLASELLHSRRLIMRLAVNDFKKRYAGSYMGVVWAFVQPIVTILMYLVVFGVIFGASRTEMMGGERSYPYVLFLTAGLVPWFFFSEALIGGTVSLIEYNYLVKKVVFKISILPLIKVISALFVHLVFVALTLVLAAVYGYYPTVYTLQLPYYMICAFVLTLAICYTTCAVNVFIRDLAHAIQILLQLLQWATPILWDIQRVPMSARWIVKLNPLVYIVNGYRMCIYEGGWFFYHTYSTTGFWLVTLTLFLIGALIFKRTKTHFPDVL